MEIITTHKERRSAGKIMKLSAAFYGVRFVRAFSVFSVRVLQSKPCDTLRPVCVAVVVLCSPEAKLITKYLQLIISFCVFTRFAGGHSGQPESGRDINCKIGNIHGDGSTGYSCHAPCHIRPRSSGNRAAATGVNRETNATVCPGIGLFEGDGTTSGARG